MLPSFAEIRTRLLQAQLPPEAPSPSGASSEELADFENAEKIQLPGILKEWLRVVNSSCVGGGGLTGINSRWRSIDLKAVFECYPQWKENRWFPVASDGCGNHYVLFSDEDRHPVAFIDVADEPAELTYLMASSLPVFLNAFIGREMGEKGWPFDKQATLQRDPELISIKTAPLPWE